MSRRGQFRTSFITLAWFNLTQSTLAMDRATNNSFKYNYFKILSLIWTRKIAKSKSSSLASSSCECKNDINSSHVKVSSGVNQQ